MEARFLERRAVPRTGPLHLMRIHEVSSCCGLSRSSIYAAMKERAFPQSIAIGGRARAWISYEVEEWINLQIRASRAGPANRR